MLSQPPIKPTTLPRVASLIFSNVSDDGECESVLSWASNLFANSVWTPNDTDIALLLSTTLPWCLTLTQTQTQTITQKKEKEKKDNPRVNSDLFLHLASILNSILHTHSSTVFRSFFLQPQKDLSNDVNRTIHDPMLLMAQLATTATTSTTSATTTRNSNKRLILAWLISFLKMDLLKTPDFYDSILFHSLKRWSFSTWLRNHEYRIIETFLHLITNDAPTPDSPSKLNKTLDREVGVQLVNLITTFIQTSPPQNTSRISLETLEDETWTHLRSYSLPSRLSFYRAIHSTPAFRTTLLLTDLNNAPEWIHERQFPRSSFLTLSQLLNAAFYVIPVDSTDETRVQNAAALIEMLYMLVLDCPQIQSPSKSQSQVSLIGFSEKVDAVAVLGRRVEVWVNGDSAMRDRIMAPLKIWALC
ncbi:hypothetical protein HDU79_003948 [Rhizoclosmatium sp. JEL0117]|nr:hypothetical protein HDU79_003948 [Rhizoclosmatium sp. JEL0117]